MRTSKELSREELERLADAVQQALYLKYDTDKESFVWDPDKEWSGFDVCAELANVFGELSMIPETRLPHQAAD